MKCQSTSPSDFKVYLIATTCISSWRKRQHFTASAWRIAACRADPCFDESPPTFNPRCTANWSSSHSGISNGAMVSGIVGYAGGNRAVIKCLRCAASLLLKIICNFCQSYVLSTTFAGASQSWIMRNNEQHSPKFYLHAWKVLVYKSDPIPAKGIQLFHDVCPVPQRFLLVPLSSLVAHYYFLVHVGQSY